MANKEIKMIEMGKKLYNIDFSDHQRIIEEAENEDRMREKEQLVKKLGIIKQSMEINKKNYQSHMKGVLRKRKDQERDHQMLQEQLQRLEGDISIA